MAPLGGRRRVEVVVPDACKRRGVVQDRCVRMGTPTVRRVPPFIVALRAKAPTGTLRRLRVASGGDEIGAGTARGGWRASCHVRHTGCIPKITDADVRALTVAIADQTRLTETSTLHRAEGTKKKIQKRARINDQPTRTNRSRRQRYTPNANLLHNAVACLLSY